MKKRFKIPPHIESQILIANKHACCICQKAYVQIHHIDEDSNNNDLSNLAVLCIEHHNLASLKGGMTKKIRSGDVKRYKDEWEKKCEIDILALARDRLNFYATSYKNPSRIREIFIKISTQKLEEAVDILKKQIIEEENDKIIDQGFKWQAVPRNNEKTLLCLNSIRNGKLWPSWLPRVQGHELDPDYPVDMSPPNGLPAFHFFDLYCQLIIRVVEILYGSFPLEQIIQLKKPSLIDSFSGSLVSFRQKAYGKNIKPPRWSKYHPLGMVRFRSKIGQKVYRVEMPIKNMYVFSDSCVDYLKDKKVCGVGILGGTTHKKNNHSEEVVIQVTPLLIGIGGFNGPNPDGWWNLR
jgi:hypothetical protein